MRIGCIICIDAYKERKKKRERKREKMRIVYFCKKANFQYSQHSLLTLVFGISRCTLVDLEKVRPVALHSFV